MTVAATVAGTWAVLILTVCAACAILRRWDRTPSECTHAPSLADSLVKPAPAGDETWLDDQPIDVRKMSAAELDARIAEIEAELAELR